MAVTLRLLMFSLRRVTRDVTAEDASAKKPPAPPAPPAPPVPPAPPAPPAPPVDRGLPERRRGGLAPEWLDAPPPLAGWLDASPPVSWRGGL